MSNSIVGHNQPPVIFKTDWEVEVDDDTIEMEGEIVDEQDIFCYRTIVPKNSNSTSVTIYFYYYAPTSEWYWDYVYGVPYKPIIPVVFATDSNWTLTQCLNVNFEEVNLNGRSNGWVSMNVNLTRKLLEGERIIFGVYSDILGYVGDYIDDPDTTMCYFYWSRARRRDYSSQIAYLSSTEFLQRQQGIFSDYEICIYMEYENEPDGFFYTRSVLGNVGAAAVFTNISLRAHRAMVNTAAMSDSSNRILSKIILKSESIGLTDAVQKLLLLLRSCFSQSGSTDILKRKAGFKKSISSSVDNEEEVLRLGENYRSFTDEAEIEARPFASRIFYRAVETVMSFWDWLHGKIREANYVVSFFTPVKLKIILDGKHMNRIYKGQTKLRVLFNCKCDLTGYASVNIKARKPDGITEVTFPAVVKDAESGIIFYDVQSENDFDKVGFWTLWPEFVFDDDRTNVGQAEKAFVYEAGT